MERRTGTPIPVDMAVVNGGGAKSITITPSGVVQLAQFQLPPDARLNPRGDWNCFGGFWVSWTPTVTQNGGTGVAINSDQLAPVIKNFKVYNPDVFGVICDDQVFTGSVTKGLIERVSNGYQGAAWDRAQIAAGNGGYAVTYYYFLPLTTLNNNLGPETCYHWLGWHRNAILSINVDISTILQSISPGSTMATAGTLKAWVTPIALRRPPFPMLAIWKRYLSPAVTAGNVVVAKNYGDPVGLKNASRQVRILTLAEVMNPAGLQLPGISTADTILSYWSDQLNQPRIDNIEAMMLEFRRSIGSHNGASNLADGAGFPFTMAANPLGSTKDATLMALFWRWSTRVQSIQNCVRWPQPADLTYYRDQPAGGPASGNHYVLSQELHEPDASADAILRRMANITAPRAYVNPQSGGLSDTGRFGQAQVYVAK